MTDQDGSSDDHEESELDPTHGLERSAPFLGGLLSGSLALSTAAGAVPHWLGALASALASPAVVLAAKVTLDKQSRQIQMAVDAACDSGKYSFDDIVAASVTSTRKTEMMANMLAGAARSENDRHIRALGRLLVDGVFSPVGPDAEYARVMAALAPLDGADIEVLDYMGLELGRRDDKTAALIMRSADGNAETVATKLPHLSNILDSIVSKLLTAGILSSATGEVTWGGLSSATHWHVTTFGHLCIGRLLAEGTS